MQISQLIGDRLYLDYLVTNNFNFTYNDNEITVDYHSQISIEEIENKIEELKYIISLEENREEPDTTLIYDYREAILILEDLKNKLI